MGPTHDGGDGDEEGDMAVLYAFALRQRMPLGMSQEGARTRTPLTPQVQYPELTHLPTHTHTSGLPSLVAYPLGDGCIAIFSHKATSRYENKHQTHLTHI